ncbi:MAG: AMP-binding protein, partial [Polyangiaceae bacterium]
MGAFQLPGGDIPLDFIPADMVCAGMIMSLLELLEGNPKPVYQYGTSDINPVFTSRIGELIGIYKRKYYRRKQTGSPLLNFIQSTYAAVPVSEQQFIALGPPGISVVAKSTAGVLDTMSKLTGATVLKPLVKKIDSFATTEERISRIMSLFLPFSSNKNGPFDCSNTRAAYARLSPVDREKLWWAPESIDWADWMMDIHMPGLEKWVLPEMEKKMKREVRALRAHTTLVSMLDESAEKFEHQTALGRMEEDGFSKLSFIEWQSRSRAVAARLVARGVVKGDRVILSAKNHPEWALAYFGILMAGATVVPVDSAIESEPFRNIAQQSKAKIAILDDEVQKRLAPSNGHPGPTAGLEVHGLATITERGDDLTVPEVELKATDVASLIYTSGTTGVPKGVMLTHANFTSLLGSITPSFPLTPYDRVLSVLPLHHTFEFTCGLLLPLSRGTRVYYLDELNGERLTRALRLGRITALVGVPALWQLLERRIRSEAREKGTFADTALNVGSQLNRYLGKTIGLYVG